MPKTINYIIVERSLIDGDKSLSDAVNRKIDEGYEPLGTPIKISSEDEAAMGRYRGVKGGLITHIYAQPMIKRDYTANIEKRLG